MKKKKIVI